MIYPNGGRGVEIPENPYQQTSATTMPYEPKSTILNKFLHCEKFHHIQKLSFHYRLR